MMLRYDKHISKETYMYEERPTQETQICEKRPNHFGMTQTYDRSKSKETITAEKETHIGEKETRTM